MLGLEDQGNTADADLVTTIQKFDGATGQIDATKLREVERAAIPDHESGASVQDLGVVATDILTVDDDVIVGCPADAQTGAAYRERGVVGGAAKSTAPQRIRQGADCGPQTRASDGPELAGVNLLLQLQQRRTRVQAEFLMVEQPHLPACLTCFGLTSGQSQRPDQPRPMSIGVGVVPNQRLQIGDGLVVPAGTQPRIYQRRESFAPFIVECAADSVEISDSSQIRECFTIPLRQCLLEFDHGAIGCTRRERIQTAPPQAGENVCITTPVVDIEEVAGRSGAQQWRCAGLLE
nr:hypothetical protein [Nocardia albiluteola]